MRSISSSKTVLAKLLAMENISIVHKNVSTAMFDLKNRELILPMWLDITDEMYDLLLGHEIGHALYTPEHGWHNSIKKNGTNFHSYINIIEDARIERKVCVKYPGLKRQFIAGYKQFIQRDVFGTNKLNGNFECLSLIDRINLYFKVGSSLGVKFTKEEEKLLARIEAAETFDEVVAIAEEIFEFVKKQKEEEQRKKEAEKKAQEETSEQEKEVESAEESEPEEDSNTGKQEAKESEETEEGDSDEAGEDGDSEEGDSDSEATEASDEGESEEETSAAGEEDDEGEASTTTGEAAEEAGDETDESVDGKSSTTSNDSEEETTVTEEPEGMTDQNFEKSMQDIPKEKNAFETIKTMHIPTVKEVDYESFIVPSKKVASEVERILVAIKDNTLNRPTWEYNCNFHATPEIIKTNYQEFMQTYSKVVNYYVNAFNARKQARAYARTQEANSGRIDPLKLSNYKFMDNLFLSTEVSHNEKNHCFVIYVDRSGSIASINKELITQLGIIVSFFRRIGVPFRVLGFSDRADGALLQAQKKYDKNKFSYEHNFALLELFNNKQTKNEFEMIFGFLLQENHFGFFELGGTPLNDAIVSAIQIAPKFKELNNSDICNVIFLTDGEHAGHLGFSLGHANPNRLVVVDPITKNQAVSDKGNVGYGKLKYKGFAGRDQAVLTNMLVDMFKDITGLNIINFYMTREINLKAIASYKTGSRYGVHNEEVKKIVEGLKKDSIVSTKSTWSAEYFVRLAKDNTVFKATGKNLKNNLVNEMKHNAKKDSANRALALEFISMVA